MATIPDLSTLTSSAQIFSASTNTLPQIRAIHKALHAEIDDKAARLRTQVGGSYRELLGTADTIVHMRRDMDAVQTTLARMGSRCGRAVVGAKVAGLGRFVKEGEDVIGGGGSLGAAARERLLEACVLAVGKVLRGGGGGGGSSAAVAPAHHLARGDRLIMAAKICVLGRLLVKSFQNNGSTAATRSAEKNLNSLRRRLLQSIKSVLSSADAKTADVLKALSAYSLPTNSGAQDVLRHFLRVRAEAMALAAEVAVDGQHEQQRATRNPKDMLRCLTLYTKTLQDVQALLPHRLPEALLALKKDTLLADESLRALEGLRLDVYERWCGDEIQYFTPFIRHDDLDGRQAKEMLAGWAKEGGEVFLQGLQRTLEGGGGSSSMAEGFDSSVMLGRIRDVVNGHMLLVLEAKVNKLRLVGSEATATVEAWREGVTDVHRGLWDEDGFDMDLSGGAAQFTQDVVALLYGRNDAVSKAVTGYQSWYRVIDDVGQVVDQLKRQRWDNDVDEIEDEETIEHRQKLLTKDDPQKLINHLNVSLVRAFKNLDEQLAALWRAHEDGPNKGPIAMYFLRLVRDIRARLPEPEETRTFGLAVVPSLHRALASTVVVAPLDELVTVALARKTVVGRSLWEGVPEELPTSPSPGVFQFLRNLSMAMGDAGGDLWSPGAVAVLKQHVREQLCDVWLDSIKAVAVESPPTAVHEGEKETTDSSGAQEDETRLQQRRDLFIQWLFDISYLGFFLGSSLSQSDKDSYKDLEDTVYRETKLENTAARERIVKTSQEYWKRTGLLFGLLA
ncbi:hypothetical protein B0T17DRAFT_590185 [Bombardia bombarda]|uniref:Conserved oligomeric Golgi complex subunit 1 n=1 Tax=Bombardia bombarda TaxID=252184 RepID=A0AA40CA52_9PEZI|nr:hypothetical protein B0T17DRAFT_590185 [Bombardia bombarda]